MRKDICTPQSKNVSIVIKPEEPGQHWSVHLVNTNKRTIKNILVVSSGYVNMNDTDSKTSTLRHFIDDLKADSSKQVELIDPGVFHLYNQFEVTYYLDDHLYLKKFVFNPNRIHLNNLSHNEILEMDVVVDS